MLNVVTILECLETAAKDELVTKLIKKTSLCFFQLQEALAATETSLKSAQE